MAKIDLTQIEGYADMTAEQKIAALEGYELPTQTVSENEAKLKAAISKANSEAADWKRQFRETQSAAEREAAEKAEELAGMQSELKALRRDKDISAYANEYIAMGYNKELAIATATADVDGDRGTALANQKAFLAEKMKAMEAQSLNAQPTLSVGKVATAEDMAEAEYQKLRRYAGLK